MDDEYGTPTAEAIREVDALCPGSASTPIASSAPHALPWFPAIFFGMVLPLAGAVGLGALQNYRAQREAKAWIRVRAELLPISPLSQVPVGTIVQSSGSNVAWVKTGPSTTEWKSLPPEDPRLPPSTQRLDR